MPQTVRELIPAKTSSKEQFDDLRFTSLSQAVGSKPAREPNCPICGRRLKVPEGYVPMREDMWRALADCPDHRLVFVDLVLEVSRDGRRKIKRRALLSDQQNPAYVKTKHLQWAQKLARLKGQGGAR